MRKEEEGGKIEEKGKEGEGERGGRGGEEGRNEPGSQMLFWDMERCLYRVQSCPCFYFFVVFCCCLWVLLKMQKQ